MEELNVRQLIEVTSQTSEKAPYVALLMKQFAQIALMGFLGVAGEQWVADREVTLGELDLETLKGIARGAQNILLAENVSACGLNSNIAELRSLP